MKGWSGSSGNAAGAFPRLDPKAKGSPQASREGKQVSPTARRPRVKRALAAGVNAVLPGASFVAGKVKQAVVRASEGPSMLRASPRASKSKRKRK